MTKGSNGKPQKAVKSESSSSSLKPSSSSAEAKNSQTICSPPSFVNGAKGSQQCILNQDGQNAFRKHSNEIKQLSGLIILKTGLGVQECRIMSQKAQDDAFTKNMSDNYDVLKLDAIYGGRITAVPLKFLNIGTSRAKEIMSGSILRERYSAMKSYINNTLTPLWLKLCPQGSIPSGKSNEDMLNEVRKAAFVLRMNKSKEISDTVEEDEEDNMENNNTNLPTISEEWESWYPQEWLGWCRYGVPSDDPSPFWVTATIADGPVDNATPFEEDGKVKKKSTGRALQRDKGMSSLSESKHTLEKNTLLAHHSYQVDEELRINSSNHDLKLIQLIKERASSDAERESSNHLMDRYINQERELLMARMNAKDELLERHRAGRISVKSTPTSLSSTLPMVGASHVTTSNVESEDDYDEDETDDSDEEEV